MAKTQFLPIPIINLNNFEENPNWSENMAPKTKKTFSLIFVTNSNSNLKDIEIGKL